jgi:hypothetical protein
MLIGGPEGPGGPTKPGGGIIAVGGCGPPTLTIVVGPGGRVRELLELLLLGEVRRLLELSPRYGIRWTSEEVTYGVDVDGPLLELLLKLDDDSRLGDTGLAAPGGGTMSVTGGAVSAGACAATGRVLGITIDSSSDSWRGCGGRCP